MCLACKFELRRGKPRPEVRKHGMSDTPTQWVWSDMKRRCMEPGRRGYENYGARGIKVCDRWVHGEAGVSGFECFLLDMGPRPSAKHQLDRSENDGDYTPGNCHWAERQEQDYNKRNTFRFTAFGREMTLLEAETEFGLPRRVLWRRIAFMGMAPDVAVTKPLRVQRRR
jgi:hypothetical protein